MCAHACHSVALTVVHSSLFHPSSCGDVRFRMSAGSMLFETSISAAPHPLAPRVFSLAGCATMPLQYAQAQSSCCYLCSSSVQSPWLTIQITFSSIQQHIRLAGWPFSRTTSGPRNCGVWLPRTHTDSLPHGVVRRLLDMVVSRCVPRRPSDDRHSIRW